MKLPAARNIHYESGPNMTPLVDVVMVILIFLMLAGKFSAHDHYLTSNLPLTHSGTGAGQQDALKMNRVDLRLDMPAPGQISITGSPGIQAGDGEALYRQLAAIKADFASSGAADEQMQVRISPGKGVPFRFVVMAQEAAMRAKFRNIGFAAGH